jgi:hypothetical protein
VIVLAGITVAYLALGVALRRELGMPDDLNPEPGNVTAWVVLVWPLVCVVALVDGLWALWTLWTVRRRR